VAMVKGAKRYILSPPNQCPKLGLMTILYHPEFWHSMLNFAHLDLLESDSANAKVSDSTTRWFGIVNNDESVFTVSGYASQRKSLT